MKKFNITVNGTAYEVEVEEVKAAGAPAPKAPKAPAPPAPVAPAAAAAAPAPAATGDKEQLVLGTGGTTGTYYAVGGVMSTVLNDKLEK